MKLGWVHEFPKGSHVVEQHRLEMGNVTHWLWRNDKNEFFHTKIDNCHDCKSISYKEFMFMLTQGADLFLMEQML